MKALYKVTTRDVDGTESRRYKTYEGAAKRFQEMSGYPLVKGHREFRLTSDFGCVVIFSADITAEIPEYTIPVEVEADKYDEEGARIDYIPCSSPYGTYGSVEHQAFGDAWLYRDCQGAW
jgi:hypothetical protein